MSWKRCTAVVLAATLAAIAVANGARAASGASTGLEAWVGTWSTPGPPLPSVLAADREGAVAAGYDGDVRALDSSGALLWSTPVTGGELGNQPVLFPDLVVVPSADRISALERSTGRLRWEVRAPRSRVTGGVLPDGTVGILAATARGALLLVDAAGSIRLRARIPGAPPSGAPHVWLSGNSGVLAWSTKGSCCHIGAVDLDRGTTTWQIRVTHRSSVPVAHRGLVVVATSARRGSAATVIAYDVTTGDVGWRTPVDGRFGTSLWGDAFANEVVFANDEGSVVSLDAERGTLRWVSEPVEPSDEAHPKIVGDRVFLTPLGVGLVEIDRATGSVVQSGPLTPEVYVHSAAAAPDTLELLVGNGIESAVWAFEPSRGVPSG